MVEVIEDDQVRARYELSGVMGVDDVNHPVASAVQDSDRAPDGGDIKGAPSCAVSEAVVCVALKLLRDTWPGMPSAPPSFRRATEQFGVRGSQRCRHPGAAYLAAALAVRIGGSRDSRGVDDPDLVAAHPLG